MGPGGRLGATPDVVRSPEGRSKVTLHPIESGHAPHLTRPAVLGHGVAAWLEAADGLRDAGDALDCAHG